MLPIKVTRHADIQIQRVADWWLANRPAVPNALKENLRHAFDLISLQPGVGMRAANTRLKDVRRVYLSQIRYFLYYRVRSSPVRIDVLALWHASRGNERVL